MSLNYSEIEGKSISIDDMNIARAKKIALAVNFHPYCEIIEIRKRKDNCEVLLLSVDLQVPSKPKIDINEIEEIAIVCFVEDDNWPEIYALRKTFPLSLPHTNARENEYPVSICVTEKIFNENKHHFNAFVLIELIRKWFELTSINELHKENQPLEPFFHSNGAVIIPDLKKFNPFSNLEMFSLDTLNNDINLYKVNNEELATNNIVCLPLYSSPITHSFIKKIPKTISDLSINIKLNDSNIVDQIRDLFTNFKNDLNGYANLLNKKLAILCLIPKLRNRRDELIEKEDVYVFITEKSIKDIGVDINVWTLFQNQYRSLFEKINDKNLMNVSINIYSTISDFDSELAAQLNNLNYVSNKYAIIGVGALGSQVMHNFARMGFGKWLFIDHDILLPHNLARHILKRQHIGKNKAISLSNELNKLLDEKDFAKPFPDNFFHVDSNNSLENDLKTVDAIIDISTSIAVERKLALDLHAEIRARRITVFLNPAGTDLVILAEDKERKITLDLLEMEYYGNILDAPELNKHLEIKQTNKIQLASNSCREITTRINQENIALHSAITNKALRKILDSNDAFIDIWLYDQNSLEVKRKKIIPSGWTKITKGNWNIFINNLILEEIYTQRLKKLPNETGGVFIGAYDFERSIIYINKTILDIKGSVEKPTTYIRGIEGLKDKVDSYMQQTNNELNYIGEWHSHPNNCSIEPSGLDNEFFAELKKELSPQGYPTIMFIFGNNNYNILFSE
jgi:integrative and conjugative element protein (TIGR02256 family)